MLVVFDVISEDVDLEPGDALGLVGESAEVKQRSRGRQADQEVDVAVLGVVTSNSRSEDADVVEVEPSRLVEDRVREGHERDARSGAGSAEDALEGLRVGSRQSALVVSDLRQLHTGSFGEVSLREADVLTRSTDQFRGVVESRRHFLHAHRL